MLASCGVDIQARDAADERVSPVQLAVVQRHAVNDVVDPVELGRRRVRQTQRVYRFAVQRTEYTACTQ